MADRLVTIDLTNNPHAADLAKLVLEQEDIAVYLDNRNVVEMDWLLSNAVGNIRVQVPESDAVRAKEILQAHRELRNQWNEDMPLEDSDTRCLACGEPMGEEADSCGSCGWSYAAEGQAPPQ